MAPTDAFVFHDVAPLHVASTASLDDLKAKMATLDPPPAAEELATYSIKSFRPNIVVTSNGGQDLVPWEEVRRKEGLICI